MEAIAWHQTFSNYPNLSFQPNQKKEHLRIKQNLQGVRIRVELSNQFDSIPLYVKLVQVSLTADMNNSVALSFNRKKAFSIQPNQRLWTDSIAFDIPLAHDLYFELELHNEQNQLASSATLLSNKIVRNKECARPTFIYGLTSIKIDTGKQKPLTVAFFGDSLTNQGYFSDHVLCSLYQSGSPITGFNAGISGNRLLLAGTAESPWKDSFGPAGIHRFGEDVITYRPDIVISLIGINDLLHPGTSSPISELPTAEQMIAGYHSLYHEAAANNSCYVALTIPPFANSYNNDLPAWNEEKESIRQKVNTWLLDQPNTIDSASFLADKDDPHILKTIVDCGDHIHFSEHGGNLLGAYICELLSPSLKEKSKKRGYTHEHI
jgi:hypothetical protein